MTTRSTQLVRRLLATQVSDTRATQVYRRTLAAESAAVRSTQVFRRTLVRGLPCVTGRCQMWSIARRDGVSYFYTSHNRPLQWRGQTWKACGSLMNSASANAAEIGAAGDITLEGIISDDGVSEADLYGGLFDDAYVEVYIFDWKERRQTPKRIIAGWTGEVSHGEKGLEMQVLGPAHRLDQNSVTTTITPNCRWKFGDSRCGIDRDALKISGTVTGVSDRGNFVASLSDDDGGIYWNNGLVIWTSGDNDGQSCESKTVDFGTGSGTGTGVGGGSIIELWKLAPRAIQIGDTFELLPGCDKTKDGANGCALYNNIVNFGGFDLVPGADALTDTPDAKY